jgi:hypothetical protein
MIDPAPYHALYAVLALWIVLAARMRSGWALYSGVVALGFGLILMVASLGKPRPIWVELACRPTPEAVVLGGVADEEAGTIELWLSTGCGGRTVYSLPYSHEAAEQLAKAQAEAREGGGDGMARMGRPFEPSLESREPMFYPPPQESLPMKSQPHPPPVFVPEEGA